MISVFDKGRLRTDYDCENQPYIPTLMQRDEPGLRLGDACPGSAGPTPCHAWVAPGVTVTLPRDALANLGEPCVYLSNASVTPCNDTACPISTGEQTVSPPRLHLVYVTALLLKSFFAWCIRVCRGVFRLHALVHLDYAR